MARPEGSKYRARILRPQAQPGGTTLIQNKQFKEEIYRNRQIEKQRGKTKRETEGVKR